jgi:ribosomal-protein-alanine N-acetyltransferase
MPLLIPLPDLLTDRLHLRLPSIDDAPAIVDFFTRNRDRFQPVSPQFPPEFFSEPYWRRSIPIINQEALVDLNVRLFLFDLQHPQRVIGNCNLTQIQRGPTQTAAMGYSLDAAAEGRSLMFEALQALIEFAFDDLHLHRLTASYMPTNARSGRLLRRLGFHVEGYARDFILINGAWADHVMTSLINPRWTPKPLT